MSRFQFRLWKKMVQFIQDYDRGKINFHSVVCRLQKTFDLANLKDMDLARKWYDYFNPLEEADSEAWFGMDDPDYEKINPCLQKMKEFLLEQEQSMDLGDFDPHPHRKLAHSRI